MRVEYLTNFLMEKLDSSPRYLDHTRVKDIQQKVKSEIGLMPSAQVTISAIFNIIPKELVNQDSGYKCKDGSDLLLCDEHETDSKLKGIHRYALYNL